MKGKTILLIVIILLAIYFGYKMSKENMTKEEENALTCKWTDTNGVVRNSEEKECYECYECQNIKTQQKNIRLKGDCIATNSDDKEEQLNFVKYSNTKQCGTF